MLSQTTITGDLGQGLPPGDYHAVSVSLPTWQDSVNWASRDVKTVSKLKVGYPRFYIHHLVETLAARILEWAASESEFSGPLGLRPENETSPASLIMLFPHTTPAWACQEFLQRSEPDKATSHPIRALRVSFTGELRVIESSRDDGQGRPFQYICAIVYPAHMSGVAKAFWQHTGFGLSSRQAEYWLNEAPFLRGAAKETVLPTTELGLDAAQTEYWLNEAKVLLGKGKETALPMELALDAAKEAADKIKQQLSGLFSSASASPSPVLPNDVFLYPSGMSAIIDSASAVEALCQTSGKPVQMAVFGFLYVDTFKVITKVKQFECKMYGHASSADLDQLERDLENGMRIQALYTEFPGNPLLKSVDLERLHQLSRKFNFYLVVDETVGTAVNLDLVPFCDLLCTSLTKMFSGSCNVMGGSMTVCPGPNKDALHQALAQQYHETYFPTNLVVMERNSRDFPRRVEIANQNAEAVARKLRCHPAVEEVHYPWGSPTQHLYDRYKKDKAGVPVLEQGRYGPERRQKRDDAAERETTTAKRVEAGYGYLLSIRFVQPSAAIAFHDALDLPKGPSLGTNFSLCCAYTLLAHARELEWAAEYGVVEHLVRISVGIEAREFLEGRIDAALRAAADALDGRC
ncbi:uncharacterized protein UV8b_05154 [Ustilaginoidea virens]|uniref:Cystathionine gamma-synthase n=1 Tax=Ustilaginoidea virens TaxID=1159556 RepID=A0A8E5MHU7_USTVR|nr:uncharacterized protein UV8b_05154 [Ustilaginoidea virens]QUC20913.1 hypothetical protein UV8b_05154 [Ustilaginoidea virens]